MRVLRFVLACAFGLFLAIPLSAQGWRIRIAPLTPMAGDTSDHVDVTLHGSGAFASQYVIASLYDTTGKLAKAQLVAWSIADTTIVTISGRANTALVRARKSGATTVTARAHGATATLVACVVDVAVDSVSVVRANPDMTRDPFHPEIVPHPTLGYGATLQYVALNTRTGTAFTPACVHWQSLSPGLLTISRRGLARNISHTVTADVTIRAQVGRP